MSAHQQEVMQGKRFESGANRTRFLLVLNYERIQEADESFKRMLAVDNLQD